MWRSVGITRDAAGLAEAAEQVDFWCRYVLDQVFDDPAGWTLQNMLTVARLMIAAAAAREESRGVHTRRDFPETDPPWARHLTHILPSPNIRPRPPKSPTSPLRRSKFASPRRRNGPAGTPPGFQLPTTRRLNSKPRWMSMSRVSPRQTTMLPGGGSFDRAR